MDSQILCSQTMVYAQAVRESIRDMLGVEIASAGEVMVLDGFVPRRGLIVLVHFTGFVQGDFAINLDEPVAARLLGAWSEGMGENDLRNLRSDYGGMLKEVLNTAAGRAVAGLEELFGRLTYHPPMVVYGEIDAPLVPCGRISLRSSAGEIDCCLVLDMAGGEVERMLHKAMEDLEKARRDVADCFKVLTEIVSHSHDRGVSNTLIEQAESLLKEMREQVAQDR